MTLEPKESPPRLTQQELLEEEYENVDHVVDVLPTYNYIVVIGRKIITRGYFHEDTHERVTLQTLLRETRNTLQYRRQKRDTSVL